MNAESHEMSNLLLPELEAELGKTRRTLALIPEGHNDFKLHKRSKSLIELANHLATVSGLSGSILASPGAELGGPNDPRKIVKEQTMAAILTQFDELAEKGVTQLKATSDKAFAEQWQASQGGKMMFSATRYMAYRNIAVNHMIHHRAQLGGYLRALEIPLPYTFGPSGDPAPSK